MLAAGCRISRDGCGRAADNALIERLWRTVKWEHIYLNPADDSHLLYQQLLAYFTHYTTANPTKAAEAKRPVTSTKPTQHSINFVRID